MHDLAELSRFVGFSVAELLRMPWNTVAELLITNRARRDWNQYVLDRDRPKGT